MTRHRLTLISMTLAALVVACGGDNEADDTTGPVGTSSPPTSTTVPATTEPPSQIEDPEYPVSDEWVVETVVRGIDGGTGGLAVDDEGVIFMGDFGYTTNRGDGIYRITPDGDVEVFSNADRMDQLTTTKSAPTGPSTRAATGRTWCSASTRTVRPRW